MIIMFTVIIMTVKLDRMFNSVDVIHIRKLYVAVLAVCM
jgi:hypothetical protein